MVIPNGSIASSRSTRAVDSNHKRVEVATKSKLKTGPGKQSRSCMSGFVANFWFRAKTPELKDLQRPKTQSRQPAKQPAMKQEPARQHKLPQTPPKVVRPQRHPTVRKPSTAKLSTIIISPIPANARGTTNWDRDRSPVSPETSIPR